MSSIIYRGQHVRVSTIQGLTFRGECSYQDETTICIKDIKTKLDTIVRIDQIASAELGDAFAKKAGDV